MTLKLFYAPGACSLVSHIALEESGADYEAVRVLTLQGEQLRPEYLAINPHAKVPALVTDQGVVTENIAILNYVADRFGQAGSVPRDDPFLAARCNALLGWFASSVHIAFGQVFRTVRYAAEESTHPHIQQAGRQTLAGYFAEIDGLCGDGWLIGDRFSAADSYVMTFYRWAQRIGVEVDVYPNWGAHTARLLAEPSVQRVLANEGLQSADFLPSS